MNEIDRKILAKEKRLGKIITILKSYYFILGGKSREFRKRVKK